MRKPFDLYGALCVTAIGMLALGLPAQADHVKKARAQPKYEDFRTVKQGQSGSTTTTKPTTQQVATNRGQTQQHQDQQSEREE
jgi:hypothetical protein